MSATQEENVIKSQYASLEYPNISMSEYYATSLTKHEPTAIALIDPINNAKLTFSEVHRKAQEFACGLLQLGITKQNVVLFFADNSLQHVIAMFAQIYLGLTGVLLPSSSGQFELADRIIHADISVLIVGRAQLEVIQQALNNSQYRESIKKLSTVVVLDADRLEVCLTQNELIRKKICTFDQAILLGSSLKLDEIPHFPVDLEQDHFLIAYTSGTTGPPKGAVHSHRSFLAALLNAKPVKVSTGQSVLVWNPLGHVTGCTIIPSALANGTTVVLFSDTALEPMLDAIQRYGVGTFLMSPVHTRALAEHDYQNQYDLSSLKAIVYGGSKLAENLLFAIKEKYNVPIIGIYGSTEFFGHNANRNMDTLYHNFEPGNAGTLLPNVEIKIVDLKSGESLPALQKGEICFRGAPCFVKYLKNEEATKSTIDQEGWYHTGDVGYYNEKECLFITERIKELIKCKAWAIIPSLTEQLLYRHSSVESVCVVGVNHATDGQYRRAYVQIVEDKSVTEQELIDYVKENMGNPNHLRAGVKFVSKIPVTVVGKIDRQHFKALVKDELITEQVE